MVEGAVLCAAAKVLRGWLSVPLQRPPWWWARVGLRASASSSSVLQVAPGLLVVGRSVARWMRVWAVSSVLPLCCPRFERVGCT
jgi:hypothetical protein